MVCIIFKLKTKDYASVCELLRCAIDAVEDSTDNVYIRYKNKAYHCYMLKRGEDVDKMANTEGTIGRALYDDTNDHANFKAFCVSVIERLESYTASDMEKLREIRLFRLDTKCGCSLRLKKAV